MDDDFDLLADYAATGSHAAFDALVKRHAGLVYGAARRRTGSADLADDVTQATFIVLARKAKSISRRESLAAWLYRVARYATLDALRRRSVRQKHERRAARPEADMSANTSADSAAVAAHLDAALDCLPAKDRETVLLYYFNGRTLQQIGDAQHVAASTVQRRLEKSLARVGHELKRHGVAPTSAIALAATIAGLSVLAAPPTATAGLTALATAATSLPATTAGPIGLAKGTMHTMTMIKMKLAAAVIAGAVTVGAGGAAITNALARAARPPATAPATATAAEDAEAARRLAQYVGYQPPSPLLNADWQTVSLTFIHANPTKAQPNTNIQDSQELRVTGGVTVKDPDRLIGFDRTQAFQVTRAVDGNGRDLTLLADQSGAADHWYSPLQYQPMADPATQRWTEKLGPQAFFATFAIRPPLPAKFAVVEGTLQALTCQKIEQVDMPFPGTVWTEVLPGVRLKFANITGPAGNQSYEIIEQTPSTSRGLPGQVSARQPLPDRMLIGRYFVDRDGNSTGATRHAMGMFPNVGPEMGSVGTSYTGQPAVSLRFLIATGLREEQVPVILRDIDLPPLPAAAPVAAGFVPPLVEGGGTSFVARGQMVQDNGTGLAFHLAMNSDRQLVVVSDVADGTPLILADGKRTLLYDPQHGVRLIDNSQGFVQMDYDPANAKPITFSAGVTVHTGSKNSTEPLSWMRFERVPGTPKADGPKQRLFVERAGAVDEIQKLDDEKYAYRFTSTSKTGPGQILARVTQIGQPVPATALDFPDLDRLAADVAVERVTDINLPAVVKELQSGSFLMSRMKLKPEQIGDGLDELRRRDSRRAMDYRNALAKQGFTQPRLSASPKR